MRSLWSNSPIWSWPELQLFCKYNNIKCKAALLSTLIRAKLDFAASTNLIWNQHRTNYCDSTKNTTCNGRKRVLWSASGTLRQWILMWGSLFLVKYLYEVVAKECSSVNLSPDKLVAFFPIAVCTHSMLSQFQYICWHLALYTVAFSIKMAFAAGLNRASYPKVSRWWLYYLYSSDKQHWKILKSSEYFPILIFHVSHFHCWLLQHHRDVM